MIVRCLTDEAYSRVVNLSETLHKRERGYGVVQIEVNNILFAIPFRSRMTHRHGFKTIQHNGYWNGIDYSKAVIIEKSDLKPGAFKFRSQEEHKKVKANKEKIQKQFEDYVNRYIQHHDKEKEPDLIFRYFGHTTLVNYHHELGIRP